MATNLKPDKNGVVTGTNQADTITWLSNNEWKRAITVNGAKGNDVIKFQNSKYKNKLNGNEGDDTIYGGSVADTITGGYGKDTIYAGAGNDSVYGGYGNDTIYAGAGDDYVEGGYGDDIIRGVSGKNTLKGGEGNDKIYGGTGADTIYAGPGNDYVEGGAGADIIRGVSGVNTLRGGEGNDKIYGGTGKDTIYAGPGSDYVEAGAGDDIIYGVSGVNNLYGQAGNDTITGGTGNDYIWGGVGNDTISGGLGTNYINLYKDQGTDTILNGGGNDTIKFLSEDNFNNFIFYYSGNDLLFRANGSTAKINDFLFGGHSAKYVQAGTQILKLSHDTGSEENDIIMSTDADDTITPGEGDDIINAGGGANTIVYNTGDGLDTIYSGGGTDTISFANLTNINKVRRSYNGDDMNIKVKDGTDFVDVMILKDYQTVLGGHSVQNIKIGENPAQNLMNVMNLIDGSTAVVNGTEYADDIYSTYQSQSAVYGTINAGAGNDVIHITNDSDYPEVYLGTGNDTVELNVTMPEQYTSSVGIHFDNGDGNNTLNGLINGINADSEIVLYSEDLLSSIDLGNNIGPYYYLTGTDGASDRVLTLSGGETFTVKNYNTVNASAKNTVRLIDDDLGFNDTIKDLPMFRADRVITLASGTGTINYNEDPQPAGELFIAPTYNGARTIDLDLDGENTVVVTGSYYQTVNLSAMNSTVYVYNTGNYESGHNIAVHLLDDCNTVHLTGGSYNEVTVQDGLDGSANIYIHDGNRAVVTTDTGGSIVDINCDYGATSLQRNVITAKGSDEIILRAGKNTVDLIDAVGQNNEVEITLTRNVRETLITGAEDNADTWITQQLVNNTNASRFAFEHYANSADVQLRFLTENYGSATLGTSNKITIQGAWSGDSNTFDNAAVAGKVKVHLQKESENTPFLIGSLDEMTQFVIMDKDSPYFNTTTPGFEDEFKFGGTKAQNGLFDIRKDLYITSDEQNGNDFYSNYNFAIGKVTIYDDDDIQMPNSDADKLSLNMARNDYRFFIDFDKDGKVANSDLLIFKYTGDSATDGLRKYFGDNGHACDLDYIDGYLKIKNSLYTYNSTYSGEGAIETISDNTKANINVDNYINGIKGVVAAWITGFNEYHAGALAEIGYANGCNTVTQALSTGLATATQINNLYNDYSDNTNWGTY